MSDETNRPFDRISLMGLAIDAATEQEVTRFIIRALQEGRGGSVMTPNLDHLRRFVRETEFRYLFGVPDLVVADGAPLIWASRIQGDSLPQRVAGSDLMMSLSEEASKSSRRVFLIGGAPGTAEKTAKVLAQSFSGIRIAGTYFPPVGFEREADELARAIDAVVVAAPDIVYVGLPFPKADILIEKIRPRLPHAWLLALGISFSFASGDVPRAPERAQRLGLEWMFRLWREPRLFRRYVVRGIPFGARLFGSALAARVRRERKGRRRQHAGLRTLPMRTPPES